MPIAKPTLPKPSLPLPTPPEIKSPQVANEVINAGYTPLKALMTYASGRPWMSTFFRQILAGNSEPMPPQFDSALSVQSYHAIRKCILKVQTELNRNPDAEKGLTEVSGVALLMPGIIPNYGDAFYADIGDGNMGLFVIHNVEQMSIYNDAAYQIEYGLMDYVTPEIERQMRERTVQTSVYDMDYVHTGKNPIIAADEYFTRERLEREEQSLIDQFFSQFFDKDLGTLSVPDANTARSLYDPYHTRFVDRLIENEKRPSRLRMMVLDTSMGRDSAPTTLWDLLVKQDVRQFSYVTKQMQQVPTRYFRGGSVLMGGVAYSGFDDVIYPVQGSAPLMPSDFIPGIAADNSGMFFRDLQFLTSYVFSEAFYSQHRVEMTMLEREAHNLITGQPINVDNVDQLLNAYYDTSKLTQFYAFPVLVALCRTASQRLV
jgi:hypothetical protein